MEICKTMQSEITKIAHKHGFDLKAHLCLQNPPYMDLVIEKIGQAKISVCHYVEINRAIWIAASRTATMRDEVTEVGQVELACGVEHHFCLLTTSFLHAIVIAWCAFLGMRSLYQKGGYWFGVWFVPEDWSWEG